MIRPALVSIFENLGEVGVKATFSLVQSGNDAAVALAEAVGGTVDQFVVMMNRQAQAFGLCVARHQRGLHKCAVVPRRH